MDLSGAPERSPPRLPLSPTRSPYTHDVAMENRRVSEAARLSLLDQTHEDLEDIDGLGVSDEEDDDLSPQASPRPSETDIIRTDDDDGTGSDSSDEEWVIMVSYVREFYTYLGISERTNWDDDLPSEAPPLQQQEQAEDAIANFNDLSVGDPIHDGGGSSVRQEAAGANEAEYKRVTPFPSPSRDIDNAEGSTSDPVPSPPDSTSEDESLEEVEIQPMRAPALERRQPTVEHESETGGDPRRKRRLRTPKEPSLWKRVLGQLLFDKLREWRDNYDFWATIQGSAVNPERALDAIWALMYRLRQKADADARGAPPRKSRRRRHSGSSTSVQREECALCDMSRSDPVDTMTESTHAEGEEEVIGGSAPVRSLETAAADSTVPERREEVVGSGLAPSGSLETVAAVSESAYRRSLKRRSSDQQLDPGRRRESSKIRRPLVIRGETAVTLPEENLAAAFGTSYRLPGRSLSSHENPSDDSMTGDSMSREGSERSGQTIAQRPAMHQIPQQRSRAPTATAPIGLGILLEAIALQASQAPRIEAGPSQMGPRPGHAALSNLTPGYPGVPSQQSRASDPYMPPRMQQLDPLRSPIILRPPRSSDASSSRGSSHRAQSMAVRMQNVTGLGVLPNQAYNPYNPHMAPPPRPQPRIGTGALTAPQTSGLNATAAPFIPSRSSRLQQSDAMLQGPRAMIPWQPSVASDYPKHPAQADAAPVRPPMVRSWLPRSGTATSMPTQQWRPSPVPTPATATSFAQPWSYHDPFAGRHWPDIPTAPSGPSTATQPPPGLTPIQSLPHNWPQPSNMTPTFLPSVRPRFHTLLTPYPPAIRDTPSSEYWSFGQAQNAIDQATSQHVRGPPPPGHQHAAVDYGPIGPTRSPMQPTGSQPGPSIVGPGAVAFGPSRPARHPPPGHVHWLLNPTQAQGSSAMGSPRLTGPVAPSTHAPSISSDQGDVRMSSPQLPTPDPHENQSWSVNETLGAQPFRPPR